MRTASVPKGGSRAFGLSSLLSPVSKASFARRYWSRRHFVARGSAARFSAVLKALDWRGAESFIKRLSGPISAWHENMWKYDRPLEVDAETAVKLCDAGLTLYKVDVHEQIPILARYLRALTGELGLSQHRGGCDIFITRHGGVVPFHFDASHNFTLQLEGSKDWRLAPHRGIKVPTKNYVSSHPLPEELRFYAPDSAADESLPRRATAHKLEPGTLLYLPPSYWHATSCQGYSLSFSFRLGSPRWLDLVVEALRIRLLADEEWRDFAYGAFGDARQRVAARRNLDKLLERLGTHLGSLDADDIIPGRPARVSLGKTTRVRKNLLGTWWIKRRTEGSARRVVAAFGAGGGPEVDLLLPPSLLQACRWISSQRAAVSLATLAGRFPSIPERTLGRLMNTLVGCHFLRVVSRS